MGGYASDFIIHAGEYDPPLLTTATFHSRTAFRREDQREKRVTDGRLVDEPILRVTAAVLDHDIPCLAFAIEEGRHVNIHRSELDRLGLAVGPWLRDLKHAVLRGEPDDTRVHVQWRPDYLPGDATLPLDRLAREVLTIVPGQKIAYVTDVAYHQDNAACIAALAGNADLLFIETPFLDADAAHAAARRHLTAAQAGSIARRAGARRMVPFHFSPRYADRLDELRQEAEKAFAGG